MKIALLNLPVDNNYGGMLQRYALMKVLADMGHEVVHLNMRFPINVGTPIQKFIRNLKRVVRRFQGKYDGAIRAEYRAKKQYDDRCQTTDLFYYNYIKHTKYIDDKALITRFCKDADVLIIGSDQVWRKEFIQHYGIGTYFGDFLPLSSSVKKVAYGASFGVEDDKLSEEEKEFLAPLYQSFTAVSVREDSGLKLLKEYGWTSPQGEQVLDPTFLLSKDEYSQLIDAAETQPLDGSMLCYILDRTEDKDIIVNNLAKQNKMKVVYLSIDGVITIEQWLRSFQDAEFIITDSYHGLAFSIIMQKPVHLFMNQMRGNARFESLLRLCGIHDTGDSFEGVACIQDFACLYNRSINFLRNSLGLS